VPPILPPQDGYLFLTRQSSAPHSRLTLDADKAAFMADSQVPWRVEVLSGTTIEPAWKTKPSWYLVVTADKMIPPAAQRFNVPARGFDGRRGCGQSRVSIPSSPGRPPGGRAPADEGLFEGAIWSASDLSPLLFINCRIKRGALLTSQRSST
jgi:hypothetical protein